MNPPRRFAKFMSMLFLTTGALLLIYVAGTWFLTAQTTAVFEGAVAGRPSLMNLPPALNPHAPATDFAIPITAVENEDTAVDEVVGQALLLPESPLVEEYLAAGNVAEAPSPAATDFRPLRIIIPTLGVDAPIHPAGLQTHQEGQRTYQQWSVPNAYAAGWHESSAPLGQKGNTVLNGHNNVHGAIFGELRKLAVGEQIVLVGAEGITVYRVVHHELLEEHGVPLRERLQNANWIAPTDDERLTLVTCWPNTTNSHRLIVVAVPAADGQSEIAPAG